MGVEGRGIPFRMQVVLASAGTFSLALIGDSLATHRVGTTAWWPASGVALAILLRATTRRRVVLAAAVGVASTAAQLAGGQSLARSAGLGAADVCESLLAAFLILRYASAGMRFDRPVSLLVTLGLAAGVATAATAPLAALVTLGTGPRFTTVWAVRVACDGVGMLLVLPVAAAAWPARRPRRLPGVEASMLGLCAVGVTVLVFGRQHGGSTVQGLPYLAVPVVLWAALRFGVKGAAATNLGVGGGASAFTLAGRGPFGATGTTWALVVNLQIFIVVTTMTALLVAASAERRHSAEVELERSNDDLERYAATVSHDLAVPLRTIEGYVGLLQRSSSAQLDLDARSMLAQMGNSTAQLRRQVTGLLDLARAGAVPDVQPVGMQALLGRVMTTLDPDVRASGADVEIGPLPEVAGDPVQLELAFTNILSNALKFHGGRSPPHILVEAWRTVNAWELSVCDDGPGIAAADLERIFTYGARGASSSAVPGSGVGLALVRRVIEAHGGTVWAESSAPGGSRFVMLLPVSAPPPGAAAPWADGAAFPNGGARSRQ